jgi:hypothetical protein
MRIAVGNDPHRTTDDIVAWAESGAMALTGPAAQPPSAAPAAVATTAVAAAADLAVRTAEWGRRVEVDGPALLGERAAITGMTRNGSTSVGGAARFVRAADGWLAINLPRSDDVAALPALVSADVASDDWPAIERALAGRSLADLVEQATLLGLAVGVPGSVVQPAAPARELARGGARRSSATPLVVDLTSLWAGPLAGQLLAAAGARVVKVEGRGRPDGARAGARAFFDLLNHGKECLALDFDDRADVALLHRLLSSADLVIEGSRRRVMDRLGIDPAVLAAGGTSWLSITAHGRTGDAANRVGFGDDAAVAGGLVVPGEPPMFVADAVADPLTGLVAAVYGAGLLGGNRASVLEVPLARVAAWAAGPLATAPVRATSDGWAVEAAGEIVAVANPRHRPIPAPAASVGADDARLRAELVAPPG